MAELLINGGNRLEGNINIKAAKNAVLPILAASILSDENIVLKNCPNIIDISNMVTILKLLGSKVNIEGETIHINNQNCSNGIIPESLANSLRSSIFTLGSILARFKSATMYLPGGCAIGKRPIDIHLDGLKQLGVIISEGDGYIECNADKIKSGNVYFSFPSVGATENLIMISVLLKGDTYIYNAAREPEVVDLCDFLIKMGASIEGAGTSMIHIKGVSKLRGTEFSPVGDRIAASTYLTAGIITKGQITLTGISKDIITNYTNNILKTPCKIYYDNDKIHIDAKEFDYKEYLITSPYPLLATDIQPIVVTLLCLAKGKYVVVENVFENRLKHCWELCKMGANIDVVGNCAIINGVKSLKGTKVFASDLRAGAALVIAGLVAEGTTSVDNIELVDRGYEEIDKVLNSIGANIYRQ